MKLTMLLPALLLLCAIGCGSNYTAQKSYPHRGYYSTTSSAPASRQSNYSTTFQQARYAPTPSVFATEDVQISTGNFGASYGNTTDGYITQAAKTGFLGAAIAKQETNTSESPKYERKIFYDASVAVEVANSDTALEHLKPLIYAAKGYIVHYDNKEITLRVPPSAMEGIIAFLPALGKVLYKDIKGTDITEEYYDVVTRLSSADSARKRYLELLAKAENVEAALKVEKELERLNSEIEFYKGKLARMNEVTQLATITVYWEGAARAKEEVRPGPLGYVFVGLYKGIKWLFVWD